MPTKAFITIFLTLALCLSGGARQACADNWKDADRAWKEFSKAYLSQRHKHEAQTAAGQNDPQGFRTIFKKLKSPLLRKYFPNHKFYREQLAAAQVLGAFAVSRDGEIIDISDGWRLRKSDQAGMEDGTLLFPAGSYNTQFADFVRSQKIRITNKREAAEFNKLTDIIMFKWSVWGHTYAAAKKDGYWDGNTSAHCHRRLLVVDDQGIIQDVFESNCMNVKGAIDAYFADKRPARTP